MPSLGNVIAALCREIDSALGAGRPELQGRQLKSDRIVLSLQVSVRETSGGEGTSGPVFDVVSSHVDSGNGAGFSAKAAQTHWVTLELSPEQEVQSPASTEAQDVSGVTPAIPKAGGRESVTVSGEEANRVAESLAEVFGEPGFDSSARATVFREWLTPLTEPQARSVIDSLTGSPPREGGETVAQAHHVIQKVLQSGPQKSVGTGAERLSPIFHRYSVTSILRLIEERWKTQMDWLDT